MEYGIGTVDTRAESVHIRQFVPGENIGPTWEKAIDFMSSHYGDADDLKIATATIPARHASTPVRAGRK